MAPSQVLLAWLLLSAAPAPAASDNDVGAKCAASGGACGPFDSGTVLPHCAASVSLLQAKAKLHRFNVGLVTARGDAPHASNSECDGAPWSAIAISNVARRWELPQESKLIVEVGGNTGEDLAEYSKRFPNAMINSYEPIPQLFNLLQQKFNGSSNVQLHNFGASDSDSNPEFVFSEGDRAGHEGESSSGVDPNAKGTHVNVTLRDVDTVLDELHKVPDVVTVNCEGCEYSVLKRMADKGWFEKVPFVQLSWHVVDGVKDRVKVRCEIETQLRKFYKPVWFGDYGWQAWAKKVP